MVLLGATIAHTVAFNGDSILWFVGGEKLNALALGALQTTMVWGLALALSLSLWAMAVLLPVAALTSATVSYFISTFKLQAFGPNTIALAAETNLEEAFGLVSQELLLRAALAVGIALSIVLLQAKVLPGFSRWRRICLIGVCGVVSAVPHLVAKLPMGLPFDAVANTFYYLMERHRFQGLLETREDLSLLPAQALDQDMVVVLVIGEAARADHFQINGYERNTTPKAAELGVVSFRDVTSCGTTTRVSVPCMLTRATLQDPGRAVRETSLVSVFRAAGFRTAWISNQSFLGKANTAVSAIAHEAHTVHFNRPQADNVLLSFVDQELLDPMERFLQAAGSRALVVLHTVGSHWLYEHHYPDEFRVFTPVCKRRSPASCSKEEVLNAYDNTILYTDHFIAEVIRRVQSRRALVFYVSDHGESLGEEGRWGHGQAEGIPEQRKVAMLVWASRDFQETHPARFHSIQAMREKPLSHDNLFHSLLDCAGIESVVVDRNLSICAGPSP